jgi:hypothetical protein
MKNVVKAKNQNGSGLLYLKKRFPRNSQAKIKSGIVVGKQIREIMTDSEFD